MSTTPKTLSEMAAAVRTLLTDPTQVAEFRKQATQNAKVQFLKNLVLGADIANDQNTLDGRQSQAVAGLIQQNFEASFNAMLALQDLWIAQVTVTIMKDGCTVPYGNGFIGDSRDGLLVPTANRRLVNDSLTSLLELAVLTPELAPSVADSIMKIANDPQNDPQGKRLLKELASRTK